MTVIVKGKARDRVGRVYLLIDAVPSPASRERADALIPSLGKYAGDMQHFIPAIKMILEAILDDDSYADPDGRLDELEAWVEQRKAVDWT